ncbi:MAG: uncharacterized protein JWM80_4196 [Cyanobacteria bacterium RYN_339]|nr:uncharacterized protein [Cyanobacteria bacterium RYN_339]
MIFESRVGRTIAEKLQTLVKTPGRDALEKGVKQAASRLEQSPGMAVDVLHLSKPGVQVVKPYKVATYNVENYFPEGVGKLGDRLQPLKTEEQKVLLGKGFHQLDSEVVGVQEIYDAATLGDFAKQKLSDMGYVDLAVSKGNDTRGINVGIMSQFPLKRVLSHADLLVQVPGEAEPRKMARDLLQATVQAPGGDLEVFVVHLKSSHIPNGHEIADMAQKAGISFDEMKASLLEKAAVQREAESESVRGFVREWNEANPGKPSVLLGDGNDVPTSKTVQILLGMHDQGEKMHNLVADELGPEAFTHHSPGGWQSEIDQLDVDDDLLKQVVPGSTTIVKTPETEAASDHRPSRFTVNPAR